MCWPARRRCDKSARPPERPNMRILHVLDHSLPLHSGYAFRTAAILREQRALGIDTVQLTTPRHNGGAVRVEDADRLRFHRTLLARNMLSRIPGTIYAQEMSRNVAPDRRARVRIRTGHPACALAGADGTAGVVGRAPMQAPRRIRSAGAVGGRARSITARRARAACATAHRARSKPTRFAARPRDDDLRRAAKRNHRRAASPPTGSPSFPTPSTFAHSASAAAPDAELRTALGLDGKTRASASPGRSTGTRASTC